jgi:hypothetical protein
MFSNNRDTYHEKGRNQEINVVGCGVAAWRRGGVGLNREGVEAWG